MTTSASIVESPLHTISLLVRNQPGVLTRISMVFARRGYNIESLVVSAARQEGYSRMTITSSGKLEVLEQIIKQLEKLIDVVHAIDHTGQPVIDTEIALIKVKVPLDTRTSILQMVEHYHAKVVDYANESMVIRVAGTSDKLNALVDLLKQWDIIELVRSGKIVMARGLAET